jgi:hypothetical protein
MTTAASTAVIRQWARDRGIVVGDRGRLPPAVVTAYENQSEDGPVRDAYSEEVGERVPTATSGAFRISARPLSGATGTRRRVRATTAR